MAATVDLLATVVYVVIAFALTLDEDEDVGFLFVVPLTAPFAYFLYGQDYFGYEIALAVSYLFLSCVAAIRGHRALYKTTMFVALLVWLEWVTEVRTNWLIGMWVLTAILGLAVIMALIERAVTRQSARERRTAEENRQLAERSHKQAVEAKAAQREAARLRLRSMPVGERSEEFRRFLEATYWLALKDDQGKPVAIQRLVMEVDREPAEVWLHARIAEMSGLVTLSDYDETAWSEEVSITPDERFLAGLDAERRGGSLGGRVIGDITFIRKWIGDNVVTSRGDEIHGDQISIKAENVGAVLNRSRARDVSVRLGEGAALELARLEQAFEDLRSEITADQAEDIRDALDEVANASDSHAAKRGIHRLLGVLSFVGDLAKPMMELAKEVLSLLK